VTEARLLQLQYKTFSAVHHCKDGACAGLAPAFPLVPDRVPIADRQVRALGYLLASCLEPEPEPSLAPRAARPCAPDQSKGEDYCSTQVWYIVSS